ncbi:MAG: CpaF family protein [Bacillota bacterium]
MPRDSYVRKKLGMEVPEAAEERAAPKKTRAPEEAKQTSELLARVRARLLSEVPQSMLLERHKPDVRGKLEAAARGIVEEEAAHLGRVAEKLLVQEILSDLFGYGPIQHFVDDADVTEIMINGPGEVWIEKKGRLVKTEVAFRDVHHLMGVVEKIVGPIGRRVDESSPMVDARLPDGSRVNVIIPPLALNGPCVTIRKFGRKLTAEDLVRLGSLGPRDVEFLSACVRGRLNVLVSGGTGSGKTTLLNVLSEFIPGDERIITIEDSAELQLSHPHWVRLEARPPNIEGRGEVTIRQLVRNSLRMRPDRIVVGEVRTGEALDMLQAMNTGHEGSLCTLHANSPADALRRLGTMVLMAGEDLPHRAIQEQIASAIDLVVHLARLRDGSRRVTSIAEVGGLDASGSPEIRELFRFVQDGDGGKLVPTGRVPEFSEKLAFYGESLDPGWFRDDTQ